MVPLTWFRKTKPSTSMRKGQNSSSFVEPYQEGIFDVLEVVLVIHCCHFYLLLLK